MPKILVVDDDSAVRSLLRRGLTLAGYAVDLAVDGQEALTAARERQPDLVVLDVMMPGLDGMAVCRELRARGEVPILMLTAKRTISDRVEGLDSGADDYLVKPFALEELLARVRALLRRSAEQPAHEILRCGDLLLDPVAREVKRDGRLVALTAKEFDLLELFVRHQRQVLRRDIILQRVWGYDFEGDSNVVDVYVRYLRSKLDAPGLSQLIHTVRGVGYVLKQA